jgi:hypothetical protein
MAISKTHVVGSRASFRSPGLTVSTDLRLARVAIYTPQHAALLSGGKHVVGPAIHRGRSSLAFTTSCKDASGTAQKLRKDCA